MNTDSITLSDEELENVSAALAWYCRVDLNDAQKGCVTEVRGLGLNMEDSLVGVLYIMGR